MLERFWWYWHLRDCEPGYELKSSFKGRVPTCVHMDLPCTHWPKKLPSSPRLLLIRWVEAISKENAEEVIFFQYLPSFLPSLIHTSILWYLPRGWLNWKLFFNLLTNGSMMTFSFSSWNSKILENWMKSYKVSYKDCAWTLKAMGAWVWTSLEFPKLAAISLGAGTCWCVIINHESNVGKY